MLAEIAHEAFGLSRAIHPDALDRIAGTTGASDAAAPASAAEVAEALPRILTRGRLGRIPRNPRHRDLALAILSRKLRRRHAYSEPEINDHLATALESLNAAVDHVTCRRYLVDLGFIKRDRAGARYLLNYPRIEATLSTEAQDGIDSLLAAHLGRASNPSRR